MKKQVAAEKHNYVRSSLAKGIPYCTEKNTLSAKHTGPHPLSTMARDKKGGKACRGSTKLVRISRGSTIASHREKIQRHPTTQDRHRRTDTKRDPSSNTDTQTETTPPPSRHIHTHRQQHHIEPPQSPPLMPTVPAYQSQINQNPNITCTAKSIESEFLRVKNDKDQEM